MNPPVRRELQLVGGGSGFFENFKRSDMFVVKLLLGSRETKIGRVEPDVVSDLIVSGGTLSFVVLRLHPSCRFVKSLLGLFVDDHHSFCKVVGGGI